MDLGLASKDKALSNVISLMLILKLLVYPLVILCPFLLTPPSSSLPHSHMSALSSVLRVASLVSIGVTEVGEEKHRLVLMMVGWRRRWGVCRPRARRGHNE